MDRGRLDRKKEVVLSVEDMSVTYSTKRGDVKAVRNITFEVRRGEALGLVGESGCGKSTAALAAMAYLGTNARISSGRVMFEGEDLSKLSADQLRALRGNKMAMVFQDPMTTLNPVLRVGEQLTEVLTVHQNMAAKEALKWSIEVLQRVNMPDPEELMNRYPHEISGGQQQRIVIAMALLCNPDLLIMDEPTTALDVTVAATVLDMIRNLRSEFDSAILYISHNLGVIARICDRVAVMYAGELVEQAPVNELFLRPLHPYTKSLLRCVPTLTAGKDTVQLFPIPGKVPTPDRLPSGCVFEPRCGYTDEAECRAKHPELELAPGNHLVRCFRWPQVAEEPLPIPIEERITGKPVIRETKTDELLKVTGLSSSYYSKKGFLVRLITRKGNREIKAVDDLTFTIKPGSILGVVGESGCGKTTLAKTVAGLVAPSAGKMEFLGFDVSMVVEKRDRNILREIQMVFQNPDSTLNPTQTVRDIISRPLIVSKVVAKNEVQGEVLRLLNAVKLGEQYLDRKPRQLSGGEKQRVAIARAFASRPELVICDEPVSSLDVSVQSSVLNTLLQIQEMYGTSLIFISHDLSVVRYLCDYIMVMYLGQVCEIGPTEEFFKPPYHPYTEALLSAVPVPDPTAVQKRIRLEGSVPSVYNPPSGCRFHTRCPRHYGGDQCDNCVPVAQQTAEGIIIYCHAPIERLAKVRPVINVKGVSGGEDLD